MKFSNGSGLHMPQQCSMSEPNDRYYFSQDYLQDCLRSRQSWLSIVRSLKGKRITAGELVVSSDGILHSYLACTAPMLRHQSPGKECRRQTNRARR